MSFIIHRRCRSVVNTSSIAIEYCSFISPNEGLRSNLDVFKSVKKKTFDTSDPEQYLESVSLFCHHGLLA